MITLAVLIAVLPWFCGLPSSQQARLQAKPMESRINVPVLPIPVILELLVAALQTGVSIPRALKTVGAAASGSDGNTLIKAGRQLELGATWDQAWRNARHELRTVSEALRAAWEVGASPTTSLRAAGEAAQRRQLEASKMAAGKLSVQLVLPLGLCLLPAFVLIGLVPVLLALGQGLFG